MPLSSAYGPIWAESMTREVGACSLREWWKLWKLSWEPAVQTLPCEPNCFLLSSHLKVIRTFFHLGFFYPLLSLKGSGNRTASFPTDAPTSSRQSLTAAPLPSPHVASLTWHRRRETEAHGPAASGMPSPKARLPFTAWGGAPKPPGVLPGKRSQQEIPRHVRCQVGVVGRGRQRNVPEETGLLGKVRFLKQFLEP